MAAVSCFDDNRCMRPYSLDMFSRPARAVFSAALVAMLLLLSSCSNGSSGNAPGSSNAAGESSECSGDTPQKSNLTADPPSSRGIEGLVSICTNATKTQMLVTSKSKLALVVSAAESVPNNLTIAGVAPPVGESQDAAEQLQDIGQQKALEIAQNKCDPQKNNLNFLPPNGQIKMTAEGIINPQVQVNKCASVVFETARVLTTFVASHVVEKLTSPNDYALNVKDCTESAHQVWKDAVDSIESLDDLAKKWADTVKAEKDCEKLWNQVKENESNDRKNSGSDTEGRTHRSFLDAAKKFGLDELKGLFKDFGTTAFKIAVELRPL